MSTVMERPQPIAGVSPPQLHETTIMTVWPSLAGTSIGRALGQLYGIQAGRPPLTVGNLIALLSAPLVAGIYFFKWIVTFSVGLLQMIPGLGKAVSASTAVERYVLTNRRVVVRTGLKPVDQRWVELDRFDTITIVVEPGQAFYHAGDLVFRLGPIETFRLNGVLRPETFRHTCLGARAGYVGARKAQAYS